MKNTSHSKFLKKKKTGQKLRFLCAVLCIFLLFSSCSYAKKDPLEYRNRALAATVSVSTRAADFDAIFRISPPDSEGNIAFEVEFLAPSSLAGLSVVQSTDSFKILLDGKEYVSEGSLIFAELDIGRAVRALSPTEPIRSIKSEDGYTRIEAGDYVIYIDPATSLPAKSVCESAEICVTVREFYFE